MRTAAVRRPESVSAETEPATGKIQDAPLIRQNRKLKKIVDIPGIIWYHFRSCENNTQESRLSASPWHESVTRVYIRSCIKGFLYKESFSV